jgi:hypothetical protein
MPIAGNSVVTLSNPTLTVQSDASDSNPNVVTAFRSDLPSPGNQINISVGAAISDADIQPFLNAAAQQLADQDALGNALVQDSFTGSASSGNGTSTVTLHPSSYKANLDGLTLFYTLTGNNAVLDVDLGANATPGDAGALTAFSLSAQSTLSQIATESAIAARTLADQQIGISTLSATASATVTI